MSLPRRALLALAAAAPWRPASAQAPDPVRRGRPLVFPRDHGAHLGARTEWWYVTGWLGRENAPSHGFQVTFFRSRTGLAADLPGALAPRHLLFAHAALTELRSGRHLHAQVMQRWSGDEGSPERQRCGASTRDTQVWVGDWRLERQGQGLRAEVTDRSGADPWRLSLVLARSQPLLLQGDAGFSRKGPEERQASHYYSEPQLVATARLGPPAAAPGPALQGRAWLDHEWSDEILAPGAVGWDWIGFNLFDGSALTAFRLRRADGSSLWAGGSHRRAAGQVRAFEPERVRWTAGRVWRSPGTGASYPVHWTVDTPAGRYTVRALADAQELDGRSQSGTVYWEGLSELLDAEGRRVGLGYLEMTGYAGTLRL